MKKLFMLFAILFLSSAVFAQIDVLWEKSAKSGNLYSWFSPTGNTERGFGYNPVSDRVYVVSRNGGLFVQKLDAISGAELGTMDVTGIAGGTFPLNDMGVTQDGVIYGCNLVLNEAGVFTIYKWSDDMAVPSVAFSSNFGGVLPKRMGDKFTVIGKASDNTAEIWFADPTAATNCVHRLTTSDNGQTFTLAQTITLPASTIGTSPSVYPLLEADPPMFLLNGNGKYITAWDLNANLLGDIPGTIVGTGSNSLIYYEVNNCPYIATFQYGSTTENFRTIMVDGDPHESITYVSSPSMYLNNNANGTGDIEIRYNPDGTQTMYVLSTNNGVGAYTISYPFIINGRYNEKYEGIAWKQNENAGFGPEIEISKIAYNIDNEYLYLTIRGVLNIASTDGIVLFLNMSNLQGAGAPAGTALGNVVNGGHLFGAANGNFKNDFETHYGFAFNPGATDTAVYLDAVRYHNGTKTAQFIGRSRQNGGAADGPMEDGIFSTNSIRFAMTNSDGTNRGIEMRIPLVQLGGATLSDFIEVFGIVVSSTAYFSDVMVPGNVTTGNPGDNPDFNTISGGPFHSMMVQLPVELITFKANQSGNSVRLEWTTATEINNMGFEIEKSIDGKNFSNVGFVAGAGNTTEPRNYVYNVENHERGNIYFRLKQIDYSGQFEFSPVIILEIAEAPTAFELCQNYPNPFNPVTNIRFSVAQSAITSLEVFNLIGEKVGDLFNGIAEPGKFYNVEFSGNNLSSGVYFYKLKSGENILTSKMLLIK